MNKICIVVGSRANYSSIKSVMHAIKSHPDLELITIASTSALLARYGEVVNLLEKDGFKIDEKVYSVIEGENPLTMAKTTGLALVELSSVFERLNPHLVITVGDRYETMATVLAAAYMNIPLAHTMGGEVTGTIDESIRHAVTKFSHIHFAASEDAKQRIIKLGELEEFVHNVGCPRIDLVKEILTSKPFDLEKHLNSYGVGDNVDLSKPTILVSQHPVTTEFEDGAAHIRNTLMAVRELGMQTILLWPNSDAGSGEISKEIRRFREHVNFSGMRLYKNLEIETYVRLMAQTACLVGNSSSGIREGAYIGTPVVNIGSRQNMRERGANVIDVDNNHEDIISAIRKQIAHGRYESDPIYGDGRAAEYITDVILNLKEVPIQKLITY